MHIYTAKQAYPTNTDITFLAVAEDRSSPVEFLWHFGDSRSAKTTSRAITKRYSKPGRYETYMNYVKYNDTFFKSINTHILTVILILKNATFVFYGSMSKELSNFIFRFANSA